MNSPVKVLLLSGLSMLSLQSCKDDETVPSQFAEPVKVEITGYTGNTMEPFLSRDGAVLFFNNLNQQPENTNLHWALRLNDSTFQYQGEISGTNTSSLEGVPTQDASGVFYFVSDRNYGSTLSTVYSCNLSDGVASDVSIVPGVSKLQAGWVNFDVEISATGETLYTVDGLFDQSGMLKGSDFIVAMKTSSGFERSPGSSDLMKNINTEALEYAACISADELTFFFTRVDAPLTSQSQPQIWKATRQTFDEPFGIPEKIELSGFVEAPTISPDSRLIYFHKMVGDKFEIYFSKEKS